ncbi:MAG: hypothetical protein J5719_00955 [Bacteroidales bacterium]|nr:hypothetical protein [Bacteroidales bacterium]
MNLSQFYNDGWQELNRLPEDPQESVSLGKATPSAYCFVQIFPIPIEKAMPYDSPEEIIEGIHKALADNQALIEVKNGWTSNGQKIIHSIVKTHMSPAGVNYFVRANVFEKDTIFEIRATFEETGLTGQRDATILELAREQGVVSMEDPSSWMFDPYDPSLKRPYLMNLSEQEQFDEYFPEHPLTQARRFVNML